MFGWRPRFSLRFELFLRTKAAVRLPRCKQAIRVLAIDVESLRLPVRRVRTACSGTLLPCQSKPMQVFHQLVFVASFTTVRIRVFNAQHKRAAVVPREEPVVKGSPRIADMQKAGWRGRKAHPDLRVWIGSIHKLFPC